MDNMNEIPLVTIATTRRSTSTEDDNISELGSSVESQGETQGLLENSNL